MQGDMKRLLLIIALFGTFTAVAAPSDTLRVLCVGNSFSVDAAERNLWDIANADGRCVIVGNMYIGGCPLQKHHANMKSDAPAYQYRKVCADGSKVVTDAVKFSTAISDEKWDIVTLQQSSPLSGKKESYEPYLGELIAFVKKNLPEARIMWHQTWAYAEGSTHWAFASYGNDQKKMFAAIVDASRDVCTRYGLEVIPCGTAIQNMRTTAMRGNLTRDGYHLNFAAGCYGAACTFYRAISGRVVTGNQFRVPHLSEEMSIMAQVAAETAVRDPWRHNQIGFRNYPYNTDESKAGEYVLPDPLVAFDGTPVADSTDWMQRRRPELLEAFTAEMYGRMPSEVKYFEAKVLETRSDALNGLATRKRVAIYLNKKHSVWMDMLVYLPNTPGRHPMFLGINFLGNDACTMEPDVAGPNEKEAKRYALYTRQEKGVNARRWPLEMIVSRGYGVATFYRGDVEPDFDDTNANGVQAIYPKSGKGICGPDQWGSISAWAWGLSRAMDYLVTDPDVDPARVAVIGHSRLGKTALWAGANDTRFAMVVSNDSGCGGAALSRRDFGETLTKINRNFPHWFCDNFKKYSGNESDLPFDQHELIALCAPRPVCVGSADADFNADPTGERLSLEAAEPVFALFGASDRLQYHIRHGKHDILAEDWSWYLDHADKFMK